MNPRDQIKADGYPPCSYPWVNVTSWGYEGMGLLCLNMETGEQINVQAEVKV